MFTCQKCRGEFAGIRWHCGCGEHPGVNDRCAECGAFRPQSVVFDSYPAMRSRRLFTILKAVS